MDLNFERQWNNPIEPERPSMPPAKGTLKASRLERMTKYRYYDNKYQRVLKIVLDHGPVCACLISALAGIPEKETNKILATLASSDYGSIKIYDTVVDENYSKLPIPLYYSP